MFRPAVIPTGLHSRLSGEAFNRQGEIYYLLEAAPCRDELLNVVRPAVDQPSMKLSLLWENCVASYRTFNAARQDFGRVQFEVRVIHGKESR